MPYDSFNAQELEEFIEMADEVMSQEIDKEEIGKLIEILSVLHQIEDRTMETDAMFEPLKDIVELLKSYGEEADNKVYTQVNISFCCCLFYTAYQSL